MKFIPAKTVYSIVLCILVAGAASADDPQTKPSGLAQYFGFKPMEILKIEWGIGEPIIADINGDKLNDIIIVNNRKARIDLLLQKKDFQPGEKIPVEIIDDNVNDIFGREETWRFKRSSYDLDVAVTCLIVADVNSDGLLDLIFHAKDGLRIALQNLPDQPAPDKTPPPGPREPTWLPAKKIDIRQGLSGNRALVAGDLNGDNRSDLALLIGDGTMVILQKSDGTLAQPVKYQSGAKPKILEIVDVDGDKRSDLVIMTGEPKHPIRIRYQGPDGKLGPEIRYELPAPRAFRMVRLDDGGRSYFATISNQSGRFRLSALAPDVRKSAYPVLTYPLAGTDSAENRDIVAADVDGDKMLDLVVSDPARAEFLLYRATEETGLSTAKAFPGLIDMRKLAAADLDGDGSDEIVVLSVKEKIIAISRLTKGRLSFPDSVSISGEPQAMDLGDVDGDGKVDLVYIAKQKGSDKYYLRTVQNVGTPDAAAGAELELTELKDKPLDLRVADIDRDGRPDVMVIRPYGPVLLVRQSEPGKFSQVTRTNVHSGLVANVLPSTLSIAQLGPEGSTAVLLVKKTFARAVIFDAEKGWQVIDQYQAKSRQSSLTAATAQKLPGGSDPAIITYDAARAKLGILIKQPDGTYRTDREVDVGNVSAKKILTGNFGGRSPMSILLCGTHKLVLTPIAGRTRILRKLASLEPAIKGARYGAISVGDINSDGMPEIILIDQAKHHIEILAFDSSGALKSATKFKVFEEFREEHSRWDRGRAKTGEPRTVRIADVTGDGKQDLILLVHDRIIIYPQD